MENIVKPRAWQLDAYRQLHTKSFSLIQAPGGSGKSSMQCMLGAAELARDINQRQLILIPQCHIHAGFGGDGFEVIFQIEKKKYPWRVTNNICHEPVQLRGRKLREFLTSHEPGVAIATNQAMLKAWAKLDEQERRQAAKRLSLRVDEAHHLSGVWGDGPDEVGDEEPEGTQIGAIVREILGFSEPTARVCLSTATFFRGDRRAILSETVRDKFVSYYLAWDDYFPSLGIDTLTFDYAVYQPDPITMLVEAIKASPRSHHLIILPATGRKFRNAATVEKLFKALLKVVPEDEFLDLVTKTKQEGSKMKMADDPDAYRVVVACRLFNEGTDWVPCDVLHNTDSCEQSQTLAVQRFFRPLRKHPDKSKVRIINYIPSLSSVGTVEEQRELLSDRFNAILTSLVTNGELFPIWVPTPKAEKGEPRRKSLGELYGAETYQELLLDMAKGYEKLRDKENPKAVADLLDKMVDEYGVPDGIDREALTTALQEQVFRLGDAAVEVKESSLRMRWFDAASIRTQGFDHLWQKTGHKSLVFGSENIDGDLIKKLLNLLDNPLTLDEIHDGIRAYFKRTGERPNFYSGYIDELKITARALNNRLVRGYGSTIAREVTVVLGEKYTGFVEQVHAVVREYGKNGVRLAVTYGLVPELGLTGGGIQNRLTRQFRTTLSAEVEKVLGPYRVDLPLDTIKRVLKQYDRAGSPFNKNSGMIAELGITGKALDQRLRQKHGTSIGKLRAELVA